MSKAGQQTPPLTQAQLHILAEYFELLAEIDADIEPSTESGVQ